MTLTDAQRWAAERGLPIAWRVHLETIGRLEATADMMDVMLDALEADATVGAGGVSRDPETGAVGTTVSVEDPRQLLSVETALRAFYGALAAAGYDTERPGWKLLIEAEPLFTEDD